MDNTDYGSLGVEDPLWVDYFETGKTIPLWEENQIPDWHGGQRKPSIIFQKSTVKGADTCVLLFAGGSYMTKAPHEGCDVADFLNKKGYHAAVLDYRCAPYSVGTVTNDAKRALRTLRYNAENFGFSPDKLLVMGFSAGGNLAFRSAVFADDGQTGSDAIDNVSSRPNAVVLGYPAVNFVTEYDDDDDFSLLAYFDIKWEDTMQCPPVFYWQSMQDDLISMPLATNFILEMDKRHVPLEFHLFATGPHGQGLANSADNVREFPLNSSWSTLCLDWLKQGGF